MNKGTGAGGKNTTNNGTVFELLTLNEPYLLLDGYVKEDYYLKKVTENKTILYFTQNQLKTYFKNKFNITLIRKPDEAYLICIDDKYILKILEKKNQNNQGSVEDKLLLGSYFIYEYQSCLDERFTVEYSFCISNFLKERYMSDNKKFEYLRKFNELHNINVFFGNDDDYFIKLKVWINQ
jgi:hypothetical protein